MGSTGDAARTATAPAVFFEFARSSHVGCSTFFAMDLKSSILILASFIIGKF